MRRRILLGSLGIALGVFAHPGMAQDRAARLGAPVAVAPADAAVTPAGLFDRKPTPSAPSLTPGIASPVLADAPLAGPASPLPLPTPRTLSTGPSLTEIRGPVTGGVPVAPSIVVPHGIPTLAPGETIVPGSVSPPMDCPTERLASCRNPRWYASTEYLLWWTRSTQLPTLLTTSLPASNGILGAADTIPILGGSFGQTLHSGVRVGGGWWFNDNQCRGIDGSFFYLFKNNSDFTANTAAFPVLARPFFNVNDPFGPYSELVGSPGLANGAVQVKLDNTLWGAQANYRRYLAGTPNSRLDGLVGFRYINFTENLSITESFLRTPDSAMTIGTPAMTGIVNDQFRAANNFYGGQIGLTGETRRGRWFVNGRGTIAFGTMHETATIAGGQALYFAPGVVGQYQGGLLALPGANIGTFSQNKFAVAPELGLNVGYHITPHLRAFVGYNFLYLSNVLRASGTIDPVIDAARIPNFPLANNPAPLTGVTRPAPQFNTTDFWAQGISFGLQWNW